jgi:hypothetical protein
VITGAVASCTVTVAWQLAEAPLLSVAFRVTSVGPSANGPVGIWLRGCLRSSPGG